VSAGPNRVEAWTECRTDGVARCELCRRGPPHRSARWVSNPKQSGAIDVEESSGEFSIPSTTAFSNSRHSSSNPEGTSGSGRSRAAAISDRRAVSSWSRHASRMRPAWNAAVGKRLSDSFIAVTYRPILQELHCIGTDGFRYAHVFHQLSPNVALAGKREQDDICNAPEPHLCSA